MCKVYLAQKITGLKAKDITEKSDRAIEAMLHWGITPISPWTKEKNQYDGEDIVQASSKDLYQMWQEDKQEVLSCNVVCDIDGALFSRGTGMECGFNRYALMRPTIYVDPAMVSIRTFEADCVAQSVEHAAYLIASRWATRKQRMLWRLKTVWNVGSVIRRIVRELGGWK